jgi:aspartyl-tRNA(Asn)/glutamyl-tRNA(Gln) amidotransferase subunit A
MNDLWRLSAGQLLAGYRAGTFTPVDALEACQTRSALWQATTNALVDAGPACSPLARAAAEASSQRWARGEPAGALDGVPMTLKDNLHAAGLHTSWGSLLLKGFIPEQDELPVARLRAAGAVFMGKTNLPEFAMQGYTSNRAWGTTRNPWNPALTPGGSSGGAVAAVATGCGPLALATDGGGSIRRPASHTGLVGFKPSEGCVPRAGGLPELFLQYEAAGPITRTVGDAVLAMQVLRAGFGALPAQSPCRVLYVPRFAQHPVDPGIAELTAQAARQFSAMGHQVEEAGTFDLAEEVNALWPMLSNTGLAWMLDDAARFAEFGLQPGEPADLAQCMPAARDNRRAGAAAPAAAFFALQTAVQTLRLRLDALFARHDFILTPAAAALPWNADEIGPDRIDGERVGLRGHAVFTGMANAAGLPAIALPCGFASGLPVGLQLVGQRGTDLALLALAKQYEAEHPWAHTWPPSPGSH